MPFIYSYKVNYFSFSIFLIYNDAYNDTKRHYKIPLKELRESMFITDEQVLLDKTVTAQ